MGRWGTAVSTAGSGRKNTSQIYTGPGSTTGNPGVSAGAGGGGKGSGCTGCEPNVPFVTTLIEFVKILDSLKSSIIKYFPSMNIGAPFQVTIATRGTMNIRMGARLEWIKRYKDTYGKFDPTNPLYINQLKDVFLSFGVNWQIDKWLREWQPPGTGAAGGTGDATRSVVTP
jgi:hypothetical protein